MVSPSPCEHHRRSRRNGALPNDVREAADTGESRLDSGEDGEFDDFDDEDGRDPDGVVGSESPMPRDPQQS